MKEKYRLLCNSCAPSSKWAIGNSLISKRRNEVTADCVMKRFHSFFSYSPRPNAGTGNKVCMCVWNDALFLTSVHPSASLRMDPLLFLWTSELWTVAPYVCVSLCQSMCVFSAAWFPHSFAGRSALIDVYFSLVLWVPPLCVRACSSRRASRFESVLQMCARSKEEKKKTTFSSFSLPSLFPASMFSFFFFFLLFNNVIRVFSFDETFHQATFLLSSSWREGTLTTDGWTGRTEGAAAVVRRLVLCLLFS